MLRFKVCPVGVAWTVLSCFMHTCMHALHACTPCAIRCSCIVTNIALGRNMTMRRCCRPQQVLGLLRAVVWLSVNMPQMPTSGVCRYPKGQSKTATMSACTAARGTTAESWVAHLLFRPVLGSSHLLPQRSLLFRPFRRSCCYLGCMLLRSFLHAHRTPHTISHEAPHRHLCGPTKCAFGANKTMQL